jgi:hypothetical protein
VCGDGQSGVVCRCSGGREFGRSVLRFVQSEAGVEHPADSDDLEEVDLVRGTFGDRAA